MAKKTTAHDVTIAKYATWANAITVIFTNAIKYGSFVGVSYFLYLSVVALAGKTTMANVVLNLLTQAKIDQKVSWGVTLLAVAYGIGQRRLRKRKVAELAGRVIMLETSIDPRRTSSHILPSGQTRREDKE